MTAISVQLGRTHSRRERLEVLIVGAGFGGIAAAIELRSHGITNVTILESASELGGTWHYNSYPGATCDVPSHLYSYSFAQRRDWSRLCSPQPEIQGYLKGIAQAHDLERLIRFNTTVDSCVWDEQRCRWRLQGADGESHEADALVLATGQLNQPHRPRIEGIDSFAGHSFHSARWDHEYRFEGQRVAVVGTGASAVQFVPHVARRAGRLTVFQRTGNWLLPRRNRRYSLIARAAIARVPGLQALRRRFIFEYCESLTAAIRHPRTLGRITAARSAAFMRRQLKDRELQRKAWPDYTFGCKRVLFTSHYLPALQRPNVELVTDAIAAVRPEGILTVDGRLHELDCIIWATGFKTNDFMFPMQVRGARGSDLNESWASGAHAHLGVTVPGFPNMFLMYGPNTNTSGGSIIFYLEAQASYLRQALERICDRDAGAIEVRGDVEAASDRELQARFAGTAWTRCDSWYRDERGRIVANWPGYMREYLERTSTLDEHDYQLWPAPAREPQRKGETEPAPSSAALAEG